jgi:enoyl-CoA hydratase/carnithine racemase
MNGIEVRFEGCLARVTLDRPERRNAFDTVMLERMEEVVRSLERSSEVDVVLLQARGPVFCAGTDLRELAGLTADDTLHWQRRTGDLVERWSRLPATTVTSFNGPAIGSGAVLGLASDLRLASDTAWFEFPELGFGINLTWSGIAMLVRLLGPDRTQRLLLLQERLDAPALLDNGMVMEVVPAQGLEARAEAIVAKLLGTPRLTRLMTKRAVAAAAPPPFAAAGLDPLLAAYSIESRGRDAFMPPQGSKP